MGLLLLLPLLLLLASLQAGPSTKCNSQFSYEVKQPEKLSAPAGGSVQIPFSFCHPWELSSVLSVTITWRWKQFYGEFIYNITPPFIHKDFENRLSLNWIKDSNNGSLQISNLRREDESLYFCRVYLTPRNHKTMMWQANPGTKLTITPAPKKTTQGPPSTDAPTTSTDGLSVTGNKRSSESWPLTTEAVVVVVVFSALLKIAILGVLVYLRWKRSKGLRTNARAPARNVRTTFSFTAFSDSEPDGSQEKEQLDCYFSTVDNILGCLVGHEVHVMQDSMLWQWRKYLHNTVSSLKPMDLHATYQTGPLMAVETTRNILLHCRAYSWTLRSVYTPVASLHSVAPELGGLPGDPQTMAVPGPTLPPSLNPSLSDD